MYTRSHAGYPYVYFDPNVVRGDHVVMERPAGDPACRGLAHYNFFTELATLLANNKEAMALFTRMRVNCTLCPIADGSKHKLSFSVSQLHFGMLFFQVSIAYRIIEFQSS